MVQIDEQKVSALPFSDRKQNAILGHLIKNEKFFQHAKDKIMPSWFRDTFNAKVLTAMLNFTKLVGRPPNEHELQDCQEFMLESVAVRQKMLTKVAVADQEHKNFALDALQPEITDWLKCRVYHEAIDESVKRFNAERYDQAVEILNKAVKEYMEVSFDSQSEVDFKDFQHLEDSITDRANALTTGLTIMDDLLLPGDDKKGSLLPGDTTLLLAPTNVGKTTAMITVARHNIDRGKSALFISLEGRKDDLKDKFWCSLMNINRQELLSLYKDAKNNGGPSWMRIGANLVKMSKYLSYVPMHQAGLTVEEVARVIRKKQQERQAFNDGKGYDLVVIDYPAKLTTEQAKGGQMQHRHIMEYVYSYFVQLALENNYHSLVAIQTNREGSKINRGLKGYEDRLLVMEDALEAWGPMTSATNVISINRGPVAELRKLITFFICKSRSSETGYAIVAKSNYPNCITHSNELGATWYRGTAAMHERVGDLLLQYKGQEIPMDKLMEKAA